MYNNLKWERPESPLIVGMFHDLCKIDSYNYHRGNAVKYIARAGRKDPAKEVEDLRKARFYLDREIERLMKG